MSNQALANISGALLLKSATAISLSSTDRASIKHILEKVEKNCSSYITIWHRWVLLKIDDIDTEQLWREVGQQWLRSPRTTFTELMSFLSGYFNVWNETKLEEHAVKTLVSELERVGDGLPPRYQKLFFELTTILEEYENPIVDIQIVKEALELYRPTFPDFTSNMVQGDRKGKENEEVEEKKEEGEEEEKGTIV